MNTKRNNVVNADIAMDWHFMSKRPTRLEDFFQSFGLKDKIYYSFLSIEELLVKPSNKGKTEKIKFTLTKKARIT